VNSSLREEIMKRFFPVVTLVAAVTTVQAQVLTLDQASRSVLVEENGVQKTPQLVNDSDGAWNQTDAISTPGNPPYAAASQNSNLSALPGQLSLSGDLSGAATASDTSSVGGTSAFTVDFSVTGPFNFTLSATGSKTVNSLITDVWLFGISGSSYHLTYSVADGEVYSTGGFIPDAGTFQVGASVFANATAGTPGDFSAALTSFSFEATPVPEPASYPLIFGVLSAAAIGLRRFVGQKA
jgi:hypothetical protein